MDRPVIRTPEVSVVIPVTRGPEVVMAAVESVLGQTLQALEVIVVLEGERPATRAALDACPDPRLRVLQNDAPLGGPQARNRGAAMARGDWLAFLDDDDLFAPEKLERQLALARAEPGEVVVTCLTRVATPLGDYVWPRRPFAGAAGEVGAWLFDRRGLLKGGSFLQTSSLMMRRALFERLEFAPLPQHEEWDFALRAGAAGARLVTAGGEPLVVHLAEDQRERLSAAFDWRRSLAWGESRRALMGSRAFSGFCLVMLGPQAAKAGDRAAFAALLRAAFAGGRPRAVHLVLYAAFWLAPMGLRQRLRRRLSGGAARRVAAA